MRSFVFWILAVESLYSVFALFTDCTWTYFDYEVVVNCSGRGLTSITRFNDSVTYLDLSHNRFLSIPVKSLPNNLKHLDISWNNIKQTKHHLDGIRTTHLRKLSLANNRLELFERGVIYNLPKTLMVFSIAGNKVTAGEYLIEMHTMSNVRVIDMSYQYHPQVNYPFSVLENCEEKVEKEI